MAEQSNSASPKVAYRALKRVFHGGELVEPGCVFHAEAGLDSRGGAFERVADAPKERIDVEDPGALKGKSRG